MHVGLLLRLIRVRAEKDNFPTLRLIGLVGLAPVGADG